MINSAKFLPIVFLNIILLTHQARALERKTYTEQTGDKEVVFDWQLFHDQGNVIINSQQQGEEFTNVCLPTGETIEWSHEKASGEFVSAVRRDNILKITAKRAGKEFSKEHTLDSAPWYQPLSYSLRQMLTDKSETAVFWVVRSDTLDAVKMQAILKETAVEPPSGCETSARRIEIRPDGLLSSFWPGSYWFREVDDVFCRYEGRHGLPGTPTTVITLQP